MLGRVTSDDFARRQQELIPPWFSSPVTSGPYWPLSRPGATPESLPALDDVHQSVADADPSRLRGPRRD